MYPQPIICVVVTAHNYGRFLDQCIKSVIGQQGAPSWVMVVVDDASTDETPEVLRRYKTDSRIKSLRLDGVGLASAANYGIALIRSSWVLRLDADDWLASDALQRLYGRALESNADMVFSDLQLVDQQGANFGYLSQSLYKLGSTLEQSPMGSGMLFRRRVWEANCYDESLFYQEDFDFWLKASERFSYVHEPMPLYFYRQHGASMSKNLKPRSCCRAEVKHEALLRRGLLFKGMVMGLIDTTTILSDRIDPRVSLLKLGDRTLIEIALGQLSELKNLIEVCVRTDCREVQDWAYARGFAVIVPKRKQDWLLEISELPINGASTLSADLAICCSPYFPFIEKYRYQETLDTLLLGSYRRVDSVIDDQNLNLTIENPDWPNLGDNNSQTDFGFTVEKNRVLSGLSAGWTNLKSGPQGYIELNGQEEIAIFDEDTLRKVAEVWRVEAPTKCPRR